MMPSGWREISLGEVLVEYKEKTKSNNQYDVMTSSRTGLMLQSDYYDGDNRITNRDNTGFNVIPPDYFTYRSRSDDGSFYFNRNRLGKTGCISTYYPVFKFKDSDDQFFYYLLNRNNKIYEPFSVGTSQKVLSLNALKEMKFVVPPQNEQEQIAKILTTWDHAIGEISAIINSKLKRKSHYVSKILNPHQNGWRTFRVSDLGEIAKGKGIAKSDVTKSGLPCIRYGEIYTTHHTVIREFSSFISEETAKESKRLKKGDIVFAGSGETAEEIGKSVAFLGDEEAYVGGDTIVLSPSSDSSLFLSYVLNSSYTRKQLNVLGQGNAVVHLYPKALADVAVAMPDVNQQIKIAIFLNSLEEEILIYKRMIEYLRTQKQGLMQQLLTGKKRVKV